jgi:hypothetical protein
MICCGILEELDTAMAHFCGGLNREIQDILDYKEYADMTSLLAKLNAKCRDAARGYILTLLQVETRCPVQHLLSLRHPHLHRVRGQLRRQ